MSFSFSSAFASEGSELLQVREDPHEKKTGTSVTSMVACAAYNIYLKNGF